MIFRISSDIFAELHYLRISFVIDYLHHTAALDRFENRRRLSVFIIEAKGPVANIGVQKQILYAPRITADNIHGRNVTTALPESVVSKANVSRNAIFRVRNCKKILLA